MSKPPELIRVRRLDSITLDKTYFTDEGYLVDEPIVTSVGVFEYKNPGGGIRRELRLPKHVFNPESLATYQGKPVIVTHDAGRVTKRNVEQEIVGTILSDGYKDGDDVRAKIIIHGIDEVQSSGLRELSLGYDLVLDETPGEWNGQPYDAIQTEITINHLALVSDGRAGEQARLNLDGRNQTLKGGKRMAKKPKGAMGSKALRKTIAAFEARRKSRLDEADKEKKDSDPEDRDDYDEKKKVYKVYGGADEDDEDEREDTDGLTGVPKDSEPQTATAEEKVKLVKDRRDRRDQEGDPDDPEKLTYIIAQQDEDIGDLLEVIEEITAKYEYDKSCKDASKEDEDDDDDKGGVTLEIKTDAMDRVVRERIKLGRLGDQLNLDGLEDMRPLDAKKAIIKKVNPNMRLDGKSKTYVNAAFDSAVSQLETSGGGKDCNYQRRQMSGRMDSRQDSTSFGKSSAAQARERMIARQLKRGDE